MTDFLKRFTLAFAFLIVLGLMMIWVKGIHADTTGGWEWPVNGVITSSFGARGGEHKGIDIAAPMGTPVVAAKAGVVKRSYLSSSYGNVIFILHKNGDETVYAHLKVRLVHKGDTVKQGQEIGEVGSTGDSTGPHLHFEVHHGLWNIDKTNAFNPLLVLGSQQDSKVLKANGSNESDTTNTTKTTNTTDATNAKATTQKQTTTNDDHEKVEDPVQTKHEQASQQDSVSTEAAANPTSGLTKQKSLELMGYTKRNLDEVKVIVKKGDSLWKIAHEYEVPVSSLKKWNHLSGNLLDVGQTLSVYPDLLQTYQVQKGDTIGEISQASGVSVSQLVQVNHLQGKTIYPEQILITGIN